jgi:hypothetical protein
VNLPVVDHEEEQDGKTQKEVNQIRENDHEGKDLGGEHDLLDQVPTTYEDHRRFYDGGAEPGPGKDSGKEKQSVGLEALHTGGQNFGKNEPVNEELEQGIDKGP